MCLKNWGEAVGIIWNIKWGNMDNRIRNDVLLIVIYKREVIIMRQNKGWCSGNAFKKLGGGSGDDSIREIQQELE